MKKHRIQKTYFTTESMFLYHFFGVEDGEPFTITIDNIKNIEDYMLDCFDNEDYTQHEKQLLESELNVIKYELQTSQEIQVIYGKEY